MGRPRLRPRKGWRWRVIICNAEGEVFYDDVNSERSVVTCAYKLIGDIPGIRKERDMRRQSKAR